MKTSDICTALYEEKRVHEIFCKNKNHLMSCGSRNDNDYCESIAYFGAIENLMHLAEKDWEYDDEDGFALYAALLDWNAVNRMAQFNPERMIKVKFKDTDFASDLMGCLHEKRAVLNNAFAKFKLSNGSWVKA